MHGLTGFQRELLYLIAGLAEPHGLAIKADIESYYGTAVNYGRLYPDLGTLVGNGLIKKGRIDQRMNSYSITHHGRRELNAR